MRQQEERKKAEKKDRDKRIRVIMTITEDLGIREEIGTNIDINKCNNICIRYSAFNIFGAL